MSEPIRVLHVFGALNPGGVETFVMNNYRAIDTDKVQFDFALTQGKKSFFDDEVIERGGKIYYFDTSKRLMANLNEVLTQGNFAAVHSHVYFYSGAVLRLAKKHNVPVRIAHAHNTSFGQVYTLKRRAYEWLMRKLILKYATDMFGCSEDACKFVFGDDIMQDKRCSVLCNGFDVEAYKYDELKRNRTRKEYGLENSLVVGHVGRFEDQKNHTRLVEQFAEIYKKRPDAKLLMVGRGSLMEAIKDKCSELGILDACAFAGAQKDTPSFYSAMDVFLFPSLYEGLGSVLIEAQANGLRVVTSKTVVPQEIDVLGNAIFVPLEASNDEWADAVLSAAERNNAETANATVAEQYSSKIIAEKLYNVYSRK